MFVLAISRLITSFKKRGLFKEAAVFEELIEEPGPSIAQCPICQDEPHEDCILCEGTGELFPAISPDDPEDERVIEELHLPK